MGLAKLKTKISIEKYLDGEEISDIKYEFIDGEVYAMAGTSQNHSRITLNFVSALLNHLRDSDLRTLQRKYQSQSRQRGFLLPGHFGNL